MMSAYAKRRSTQRNSSIVAAAVNSPPSPQFGGDEDGGTGGGISGSGGGTGGADDGGDQPIHRGTSSIGAETTRHNGATPFDERVKNVRSRIREMVAVAGEDSSDGSETFDTHAAPSKAVAKGSRAARPKARASAPAPALDEAAGDGWPGPAPAERRRSQPKPASSGPQSQTQPSAAAFEPPPPTLGASGPGGSGPSSSPRPRGPAARASAPAAARQRSASPPPEPHSAGQQLVGRDGAAHQGARVRVVDPRIARFVEPTGTIVEVRCGGERVRVEHDGEEAPQRYYNTGKGGEYQLFFEFAAEALARTSARRAGSQRASAAPPVVLDSPPDSPADPPRASRVPARTSLAPSELDSPESSPGVAPRPRASGTAAKPRASWIATARRRAAEPPEIAADTQPEIAEPKAATRKSRYSQLRHARQPSSSSTADATAKPPPPESNAELDGRKVPYSQRRSLRMSQMQASASGATTADAAADRAPDVAARHAASAAMLAGSQPESAELSEQSVARAPVVAPGGTASSACQESRAQPKASREAPAESGTGAGLENLRQEQEQLLSRLRNLEQTFVRDLGAVKDDVHLQIEATEKRIVTRVLEELDHRIRLATGMASAKVAGKLSVDKMFPHEMHEPAPQGVGTPVNEEPEQEYDTCDLSDVSQASGNRRASEMWRPPLAADASPPRPEREVSSAELADNRQRLENINNAARRITQSFGGTPATSSAAPPSAEHEGSHTPDFSAAPSFAGSPATVLAPGEPDDGLDKEMQRLAELRRFASNVLQAAEAQCPPARPSATAATAGWAETAHGGRMSHARGQASQEQHLYAEGHSDLRDAASQQDRYAPPSRAQDGEGGQRRGTTAAGERAYQDVRAYQDLRGQPLPPWEDGYRNPTPRGLELPAQPPPHAPPMHAEAPPAQPWPAGSRGGSMGRARRSAAQPLHVPWPEDWEQSSQSEARLVF